METAKYANALAHIATPDSAARRRHEEGPEDGWIAPFLSPFETDIQKIEKSKSFRRLKGKAQVQVGPHNSHTRDRMAHTLEVANTAVAIAAVLGLNRFLCWAAALGHDLGHAPFGHRGERFLSTALGRDFRHNVFSCVLTQSVERRGAGLNLTHETLSAILHHSRPAETLTGETASAEAAAVMYADKIGYIFGDISDIFLHRRYGQELADRHRNVLALAQTLGERQWDMTKTCLLALIRESAEKGRISFSESETALRFAEIRRMMFEVYTETNPQDGREPALEMVFRGIVSLDLGVHPAVTFASLTDWDVIRLAERMAARPALTVDDLTGLAAWDVIQNVRGRAIDPYNPDLGW